MTFSLFCNSYLRPIFSPHIPQYFHRSIASFPQLSQTFPQAFPEEIGDPGICWGICNRKIIPENLSFFVKKDCGDRSETLILS
jgi:hypothetical protein